MIEASSFYSQNGRAIFGSRHIHGNLLPYSIISEPEEFMSFAHLHLVLNHVPVIGVGLALLLLLYGLLRRSDEVVRATLIGFVALALVTVPAYLTGEPAEKAIKGHPGTLPAAVSVHEDAAALALGGMELVGAAALVLLVSYRRRPLPKRVGISILVLACLLSGLMVWTANLGGKIHHTEIAGTTAAPAVVEHDD